MAAHVLSARARRDRCSCAQRSLCTHAPTGGRVTRPVAHARTATNTRSHAALSLTAMMFSCRRWRSSLISRSVRRASVRFSKALPIFLIATFSPVCWFLAEHTTPYAPLPMACVRAVCGVGVSGGGHARRRGFRGAIQPRSRRAVARRPRHGAESPDGGLALAHTLIGW